jgi:hypothetical protein
MSVINRGMCVFLLNRISGSVQSLSPDLLEGGHAKNRHLTEKLIQFSKVFFPDTYYLKISVLLALCLALLGFFALPLPEESISTILIWSGFSVGVGGAILEIIAVIISVVYDLDC